MLNITEDHLYHYTSVEAAAAIVSSGELRFSKIDRLNDINEIRGPEVLLKDERDKEELRDLLLHFTQISLTADKNGHYGFDIPAMWGHYAQNGHGACLIINKRMVLSEVMNREMDADYVLYSNVQDLNNIFYDKDKYGSPDVFIRACKEDLFYHKTKDWEYEQEFRLITIDDAPANFSIKDAIEGIILYGYTRDEMISSNGYKTLSGIKKGLDIFRYKQEHGQWNLYDMDDNSLRPPVVFTFSCCLR